MNWAAERGVPQPAVLVFVYIVVGTEVDIDILVPLGGAAEKKLTVVGVFGLRFVGGRRGSLRRRSGDFFGRENWPNKLCRNL